MGCPQLLLEQNMYNYTLVCNLFDVYTCMQISIYIVTIIYSITVVKCL